MMNHYLRRFLIGCIGVLGGMCLLLCSCSSAGNLPENTSADNGDIEVYRAALLDETTDTVTGSMDYFTENGLGYYDGDWVVDECKADATYSFSCTDAQFTATYGGSYLHKSDVARCLDYDVYQYDVPDSESPWAGSEVWVFQSTGKLHLFFAPKFMYPTYDAPVLLTEFTEEAMEACSRDLLTEVYGEEFLDYLGTYYRFDYARFFEYDNTEINRYVVCYRGYLNGVPTDDTIYVQYSPKGQLDGISTKKYLFYYGYDTSRLKDVAELELAVEKYVAELGLEGYERCGPRLEAELVGYYTLSAYGELHYISEWAKYFYDERGNEYEYREWFAMKAE